MQQQFTIISKPEQHTSYPMIWAVVCSSQNNDRTGGSV